ncbi:MAG TPA: hypothetical protein VFA07_09770 [Chthonomonadaceae bacterium]|nr:hypothetical protein [Chthonomonadaceae bacterium]
MSGEKAKKKDGHRKEKMVQRSVEAQENRPLHKRHSNVTTDQGDIMEYKPGSAGDRTPKST